MFSFFCFKMILIIMTKRRIRDGKHSIHICVYRERHTQKEREVNREIEMP